MNINYFLRNKLIIKFHYVSTQPKNNSKKLCYIIKMISKWMEFDYKLLGKYKIIF